jgi:hypothetical protein
MNPEDAVWAGWTGLQCALCAYAVISPDTDEGILEMMYFHMANKHPGTTWADAEGKVHHT